MEVWGGNREMNEHRQMTGIDAWVYSLPYGGAVGGGDLYYLSSCASGRVTRMLLADVSGHGSAVSGIATSLRTLMRKSVNMISQRSLVQSMNRPVRACIWWTPPAPVGKPHIVLIALAPNWMSTRGK